MGVCKQAAVMRGKDASARADRAAGKEAAESELEKTRASAAQHEVRMLQVENSKLGELTEMLKRKLAQVRASSRCSPASDCFLRLPPSLALACRRCASYHMSLSCLWGLNGSRARASGFGVRGQVLVSECSALMMRKLPCMLRGSQ